MRTIAMVLLFSSLSSLQAATLQPGDAAARDIDRFVARMVRNIPELTSVGVAVVRDGKPYYARAFGAADVARKIAAGPDTGYYIASSTKSFTGLACAILANRGAIDLDAPITRYLPEVRMAPPLDAEKLTLRRFLTHTSAIENDAIVFRTAFTGEHTPEQLVALLSLSKPGKEGYHYDNLGYVVASLVIERVTGRPWQRVLDELIFTPLGMKNTTAYMSVAQRRALASPYDLNRKGEMELLNFVKNDQMMHAAGGIVTTPVDLTRWLEANLSDGRIGTRQVLPAAALREAHRKQVDAAVERDAFKGHGYGLGWVQATYDGEPALFHMGGFEGWRAHVSLMPERKLGVAVVTNSGGSSRAAIDLIAAYVYDRLREKPDLEAKYAEALEKMKATVQQQRERYAAEAEKRAQRTSMLGHPSASYAGVYESPLYGRLTIEQRGGALVAKMAQLAAPVEAFTEPETARVELVPGSGEVLRFTFGAGEAAESVQWSDEVFRRVR